MNRCTGDGKCAFDPSEWLPPMNRFWFAARVIAVKRKYGLTVDRRETAALERVLFRCTPTQMVFTPSGDPTAWLCPATAAAFDALRAYDANGNGRITCKEARRHGIAPVSRGHHAYPFMYDRDGDGVVCE